MKLARYDNPLDMEPLVPLMRDLEPYALELIRSSAELGSYFALETRLAIAELVRSMNGYYSNLIEGHRTRPIDIEAALRQDFSTEPKQREIQMLHHAHLETQHHVERRLQDNSSVDFLSPVFLSEIHEKFYSLLPPSLHHITDASGQVYPVKPGQFRDYDVHVGHHLAPPANRLEKFLVRFQNFYASYRHAPSPQGVIAAMAAHHRLVWIHPFGDGNGRVGRLLTHAWLIRFGMGANGLWTLSRGLARNVDRYKQVLSAADQKKLHDFDGRGYLSERRLTEFCAFMMECALDQMHFMRQLLDLRQLEKRLLSICALAEHSRDFPKGSGILLRDVLLRGAIPRGEAARILNVSARTAQTTVGILLAKGLLKSPSPKGQLTIGFPGFICAPLFPDLYPSGSLS